MEAPGRGTDERPLPWTGFRSFPVWAQVLVWAAVWPVPIALYAASRPDATRARWWVVSAVAAVVWIAAVGASSSGPDGTEQAGRTIDGSSTTTQTTAAAATGPSLTPSPAGPAATTSTGPRATTAGPASTTTTNTAPAADATAVLAGLRIAPEGIRTGYDRDLFKQWVDADGDGCDTREEVLRAESRRRPQVDPLGCNVLGGDWYSLYDGRTFTDPSALDIDHVVALAEAWDSGASAWDAARREAFANDLDHPQALRAVSASSNRSKSDLDPAQWKPVRDEAWCEYANDWVAVKKAWELTADQDEVDDLKVMLRTCTGGARRPG